MDMYEDSITKYDIPVRKMLAQGALSNVVLHEGKDELLDEVWLRLEASVLQLLESSTDVPADWWQHFKERWMPRQWRRRFPIKYTTITTHRNCPHVKLPENARHIQWLVSKY